MSLSDGAPRPFSCLCHLACVGSPQDDSRLLTLTGSHGHTEGLRHPCPSMILSTCSVTRTIPEAFDLQASLGKRYAPLPVSLKLLELPSLLLALGNSSANFGSSEHIP